MRIRVVWSQVPSFPPSAHSPTCLRVRVGNDFVDYEPEGDGPPSQTQVNAVKSPTRVVDDRIKAGSKGTDIEDIKAYLRERLG